MDVGRQRQGRGRAMSCYGLDWNTFWNDVDKPVWERASDQQFHFV